ncbi:MAG: glycosyltransferase [Flavobacteriaceae bacterium]|nr:glycosyltransferase [Flavobacteriaceae bacterium]
MKFSLIICTYMRPASLLSLLSSVKLQTLYPNEILIIDGSTNLDSEQIIKENDFENLKYYQVNDNNRGLTKQRNYGVDLVGALIDVVCFLDDDIILTNTYFEELIATYKTCPDAIAVGGYISNEVQWKKIPNSNQPNNNEFCKDGWYRNEPSRFILRKRLGLLTTNEPGFMPKFSHGRSVSFFPPSNRVYETELFMGGVASYKIQVFKNLKFSSYFEGYGLYEDADFCLRLSKFGKLYVNTLAKCKHYHNESGRPNKFLYGKMVVRNGWYVWRVKYPNPSINERFKWNATSFLLTIIRFTNTFSSDKKMEAFTESLGRIVGWFTLIYNKPKVE